MDFTFEQIIEATNAKVLYKANVRGKFSINTDSRSVKIGDVFIPLVGEKFDGHDFIDSVLKQGALGYFTSDKKKINKDAKFVLFVKDTLKAYLSIAKYYKKMIDPITIAITGSSGKTTTKEMMACVVAMKFKTHKSELNYNNEIGLAKTILSMPVKTEVLVVEMGMRGLGEIELLSKYAEPDISIITNVGTAHIGRLKTLENIAKAKCEIAKYTHVEGSLIVNHSELLHSSLKFKGNVVEFGLNSKALKILEQEVGLNVFEYKKHKYKLNVAGDFNIENALSVIEAGLKLGINEKNIAKGLKNYQPIEKRWEMHKIKGFKIINDSYNANPDSVLAVLKSFLKLYEPPLCLVLGDMGELGEESEKYHKFVGRYLKDFKDIKVLCVGKWAEIIHKESPDNSLYFQTNQTCVKYILDNIEVGTTILLKGSRTCKLEQIVEEMENG